MAPPDQGADTPVDPPADTDRDSDVPWPVDDSDPPPPPLPPRPPASWGSGFVDLSAPWVSGPDRFEVLVGVPLALRGPQEAPGLFAKLDDDPEVEVIVGASDINWPGAPRLVRAYGYDVATGTLTRDHALEAEVVGPTRDAPWGAMDLDGDGLTDLLVAGSTPVLWGRGDGTFEDGPTLPREVELLGVTSGVYPMDIDGDGWLDLMVGDSRCQEGLIPWVRVGQRTYELRRDSVVEGTESLTVESVVVLPTVDDGWVAIAQGSLCDRASAHPGFYRAEQPAVGEHPVWRATDVSPPDVWWHRIPEFFGLPFTGVAPMGAAAPDMNGDGRFDMLLVLSGSPLTLLEQRADGTFRDASWDYGALAGRLAPHCPLPEFAWSAVTPDLDADGRPDLVLSIGDDMGSFTQLDHPMRNQIQWNAGDYSFIDVTEDLSLPIAGSYHGLYIDDLDADGDPDLLFGGYGVVPRLVRNEIDVGRTYLAVRLEGTTSNHAGVGATVHAVVDGAPDRYVLIGETGNMVSRAPGVAWLGLADAGVARELRVVWPSGLVQVLRDVGPGALTVREPPTLEVRSESRHVDVGMEVELVATPRDEGGALRSGVAVTWRVVGGDAALRTWEDPDGTAHAAVRLDEPGSVVVEAAFDGVPVRVRPRRWWDAVR